MNEIVEGLVAQADNNEVAKRILFKHITQLKDEITFSNEALEIQEVITAPKSEIYEAMFEFAEYQIELIKNKT